MNSRQCCRIRSVRSSPSLYVAKKKTVNIRQILTSWKYPLCLRVWVLVRSQSKTADEANDSSMIKTVLALISKEAITHSVHTCSMWHISDFVRGSWQVKVQVKWFGPIQTISGQRFMCESSYRVVGTPTVGQKAKVNVESLRFGLVTWTCV